MGQLNEKMTPWAVVYGTYREPFINLAAAIIATATFLVITAWSRYISLGSVVGVMIGAIAVLVLALADFYSNTYMIYGFIACAVIVWQHRDNIQRIRQGSERRLGHPATKVE